ncbi:MAG: hypothetical protein M5U28_42505 [Sandaracinaceae bacterium]|nr:hypothetical protein [Sandaracinaceae bacterium]
MEVRLDGVAAQAEVELPEEQREDGLDLQDGEGVAEALVPPAAEGDEAEVALLVLLAARPEAIRIEGLPDP